MKKNLLLLLLGFNSLIYAQESTDSKGDHLGQKPPSKNTPEIKVTYTICEGFIVEVADKKIMLDVLTARRFLKRQAVPDSVVRQMENALPPFDSVDIIFATHAHLDHFDPDLVVQYMEANTNVILVCPQQAADILKALGGLHRVKDRIHPVPYKPFQPVELKVKDIQIKCLPLCHSGVSETDNRPGIQNLGYLIKYNGRTILHIGDNNLLTKKSYEQYKLNDEPIDIAFLQALFWNDNHFRERRNNVTNLINPKNIILMHLMHGQNLSDISDEMKAKYPEMIFFQNCLETKIYK